MAKDERRRRRRRRKKKKGSRAGHQASASEQTEDEEEEHFRPPHKLKLVLKLPRPYPSSSFQATNSSSSSIPTTNLPPRGEASASTSTSGDLSDTSSSPNPTQKQRDEVEAEDDVTVVHSRKPLPPALHSPSALSSSFGEDDATEEEDEEDDDNDDDDDDGGDGNDTDMEEKPPKKRKLNAVAPVTIAYGSQIPSDAHPSAWCSNKTEKKNQYPDVTNSVPDPVSKTPVPEKKMVHFILDKLQKKDSYGVFSEPVDPEELPDYHRVIQHPMDFGTIRKKLAKGDYTCLEELEMDVFLICTNAMHYNASITIYYKQARAIQELAKKKFASIRLDPERIEAELRLASKKKPGYSSKKTRKPGLGRFQFEPTSSDLFSGATLATVGDYSNWSNASLQDSTRIRRAATAERPANGPGYSGISGWTLKAYGSADGFGPLTETKAEKSEELQGSMHKALRNGRRSLQLEENHRATYKPYYHVENQNDAIFAMLNGESKQLIPIGLRSEYAYATSLCRFAANAGPVAWMIAAQKIQRALPPHVPFGPGWVGDYEAPPRSLSSQKGRSAALSGSSLPDILRQSKVKLNTSSDAPIISGGELPKNLISECRSVPSSTQTSLVKQLVSNSTVRQPPDYCLSSSNGRSDVNKIAGLNTYGDIKVSLPSHEVNHGPIKAILPVATSNDLSLPNTKFGSEVTQSRLLEMVSRNNTYIHRPSLKQDDVSNPIKSFQVKQSESMTIDGEGCGLAREASDTLKHVCSPAEINAPATRPKTSLNDYQAGSVAFQASQATNNRGNNMQKSNSVDNFMCSKMLAMHQRGSNLSVNSPVFVNSSFLSTDPSIKRNDPTVQAWMQSQNACLAEADAASRNKMPDTTSSHTEQHESQSRNFSAITCVVSKEMQLDVQCQPFSQYSRFHSQNSAKLSNNTPVSGPAVESQGPKIGIPSYVQMPEGIESFESHMHSWKGLPTQFLSEPVSDLSPSKPLNLNLGLQKPKSPARQFSGMSADSQQPDLALQL